MSYHVQNGYDTGKHVMFDDLQSAYAFLYTEAKRLRRMYPDQDFEKNPCLFLHEQDVSDLDEKSIESDQTYPWGGERWWKRLVNHKDFHQIMKQAQTLSDKIEEQEKQYNAKRLASAPVASVIAAVPVPVVQQDQEVGPLSLKRKRLVTINFDASVAEKEPTEPGQKRQRMTTTTFGPFEMSTEQDAETMKRAILEIARESSLSMMSAQSLPTIDVQCVVDKETETD